MSIADFLGPSATAPSGGPAPPVAPAGGPPVGAPMGAPPAGAPLEIDVDEGPEPGAAPGGGPLDLLRDSLASLQDYIAADHDEEDKAEGTKALAILQRILARNQRQGMSTGADGESARALRRALSG